MATTPHTYARFIGRVGALAVALGVGVAITNSPGIALAENGSSGTSGAAGSAGTSGSSAAGGTRVPRVPRAHRGGAAGAAGASGAAGAAGNAGSSTTGSSTGNSNSPSTAGTTEGSAQSNGDDTAAAGASGDSVDANGSDEVETDVSDDQKSTDDITDGTSSDTPDKTATTDAADNADQSSKNRGNDAVHNETPGTSGIASASPDDTDSHADIADVTDTQDQPAGSALDAVTSQAAASSTFTRFAAVSEPPAATSVTTGLGGLVNTVLSVFGLGTEAASGDPIAPPQAPMLWTMLGWVRREVGNLVAPFFGGGASPVATLATEDTSITADSPLATDEQLAAEKLAAQTANTLPVALAKLFLRQQFLSAAQQQYPNGLDADSLAALDKAVDEYAMGAAFQQQILDSMNPTVVMQVAPPHIWYGQDVAGSRHLVRQPGHHLPLHGCQQRVPVRRSMAGSHYRKAAARRHIFQRARRGWAGRRVGPDGNDIEVNPDGSFDITVSTEASDEPNHLQLTTDSTLIAARNTLSQLERQDPMSLSIDRVGGPPDSLFAQLGGFAFPLGPQVASNPLLTTLVSLVPPLPYMPPVLRGAFTAVILLSGARRRPSTWPSRPRIPYRRATQPNGQPAVEQRGVPGKSVAERRLLQLEDGQALVLTINPGRAGISSCRRMTLDDHRRLLEPADEPEQRQATPMPTAPTPS